MPEERRAPVRVGAFAAQGPQNPGFRVRAMLPATGLARHGITVDPFPLFDSDSEARFREAGIVGRARIVTASRRRLLSELRGTGDGFEVALIQRQADMHPSLELERAAIGERRLVWDVDDAIWNDALGAGNHPLAFMKRTNRKVRWLADRADAVLAGNRILAEHLAELSDRVTVVPSLVDTDFLSARDHIDSDEIVLGWVGSRPTSPYLRRLQSTIREVRDRAAGKQVGVLLVGARPDELAGLEADGITVERRPWSVESERMALAEMDIGLMPLPDTGWTRGKCAYKAILYMAAGIPVVADDVGVARETIGDGGRVVEGPGEWLEALEELSADPALRARHGGAGRLRAEQEYSLDRWVPELAVLIRGDGKG